MSEPALLSEVELLVLLSVARLGGGGYAVTIREELSGRAGVDLPRGSVYVTLERLERKGLVRSRFSDPTPERGGKAKRLFALEAAALPPLRKAQQTLQRMWEGLDLGTLKA